MMFLRQLFFGSVLHDTPAFSSSNIDDTRVSLLVLHNVSTLSRLSSLHRVARSVFVSSTDRCCVVFSFHARENAGCDFMISENLIFQKISKLLRGGREEISFYVPPSLLEAHTAAFELLRAESERLCWRNHTLGQLTAETAALNFDPACSTRILQRDLILFIRPSGAHSAVHSLELHQTQGQAANGPITNSLRHLDM